MIFLDAGVLNTLKENNNYKPFIAIKIVQYVANTLLKHHQASVFKVYWNFFVTYFVMTICIKWKQETGSPPRT